MVLGIGNVPEQAELRGRQALKEKPTSISLLYIIIKFPYNARSDWLKQGALSENRVGVDDITLRPHLRGSGQIFTRMKFCSWTACLHGSVQITYCSGARVYTDPTLDQSRHLNGFFTSLL